MNTITRLSLSLAAVPTLLFAPSLLFAADLDPIQNAAAPTLPKMPDLEPPSPKNPAESGVATPAPSKKERMNPQTVEIRLKDGSSLRGELKSSEPISLKTSFGVLKFPMESLLQLSHGDGIAPLDEKQLAATLDDFKGADLVKRAAADRLLLDAGKNSLDPLFTLRSGASPELKPRLDDLLKRIYQQADEDADARDTVRTVEFTAAGTLAIQALKVSSKLGDLSIKLNDLASVRWVAHGDLETLELDALVAVRDWTDTGIDSIVGEQMTVNCSGNATLFNTQITPTGISNQDNQPFPFGAVIGKFGPDGEPFLIGDEKTWKPDSNQRLFLRIYASDEVLQNNGNVNGRDRGRYNVRIACGARIKEASLPPPSE